MANITLMILFWFLNQSWQKSAGLGNGNRTMNRNQEHISSLFNAFKNALAEIRVKLAVVNAVLILVAIGVNGTLMDYAIAGSYFFWGILILSIKPLRNLGQNWLRVPFLVIDLAITSYMITRTGGSGSYLYPFLFFPVVAAVIRCKFGGILVWTSLMALVLVVADLTKGTFELMPLFFKVSYLYLIGIFGGFLIQQTFTVTEEVSTRLVQRNNDLQRLSTLLSEIAGSLDVEQIFTQTLKIVDQHNLGKMAAVLVFDERGEMRVVSAHGWENSWLERYHAYPLSKYSLALAPILVFKKPLLCPNIGKHSELRQTFAGIPITGLYAFPLLVAEEVVGMLLLTENKERTLAEEEIQILSSIANQAGIAVQNAVNLCEEKLKADTDGLTGLYNRRYLNEKIEVYIREALHQGEPFSFILLDVDNFKKYNDTFGHPAGDVLLKKVASLLKEAVREQDVVARYGGEEFAVMLKRTSNITGLQIAEKIRFAIENIPQGKLESKITVSIWVGTLPDHASNSRTLLEFTDKSLYHAKHTGKNRVCCGYEA